MVGGGLLPTPAREHDVFSCPAEFSSLDEELSV